MTPAFLLAALAVAAAIMTAASGLVPRIQGKTAAVLLVVVVLWIALILVL